LVALFHFDLYKMSHIDYYYGSGWDVEDEECEIAELLGEFGEHDWERDRRGSV
jgi:hypothetical protein